MTSTSEYDYIVAGGGLCGCVVASRLKQAFPDRSVALIESGPDSRANQNVSSPAAAWMLPAEYYQNYATRPQGHLNNRSLDLRTGRLLGGGSAVNYGGWTRGDRSGYDEWAKLVDDERWSYAGLLPFFKRAETWSIPGREQQHGYEGPIHPDFVNRGYPLREPVKQAMLATGLPFNEDSNSGDVFGVVPLVESWYQNKRTFVADAYDLKGVDVLTSSYVSKILIHESRAIGVVLQGGQSIRARQEVIISCGAIRTPQLLMLSGIGPKDQLSQHGIPVKVDTAGVGRNLHDHVMYSFWYKLRNPEDGLAVGSEKFMANPKYFEGNAMDWMVNASMTEADVLKANDVDQGTSTRKDDIEITFMYVAAPTAPYEPPPMDGSHVTISAVCLSTTSRGQVTLASADAQDRPLVDPNYLATEHDRAVLRAGGKLVAKMMDSAAGQEIAVGETPPGPFQPLTQVTTDAELDERARACSITCYHYAGTAAMGDVIDTECRVKGIAALRVVDASILPVSIGAHLQAVLYGVAERAADMIIEGST